MMSTDTPGAQTVTEMCFCACFTAEFRTSNVKVAIWFAGRDDDSETTRMPSDSHHCKQRWPGVLPSAPHISPHPAGGHSPDDGQCWLHLGGIQETKVTAALATPTLLWTSTGSPSSVALALMPRRVIFVSCGSGVVDHIDTVNVFLTP